MRRALLLAAVLAAPALALAQAAGTITVDNGRSFPFINLAECNGSGSFKISWTINSINGGQFVAGGSYQLYASNTTHPANDCTRTGNGSGITAGPVGGAVTGQTGATVTNQPYTPSALAAAAGASCTSAADQPVYLCVAGTVSGVVVGIATTTLTVQTTRPPRPVITEVRPGDGALNLDWGAGTPVGTTDVADSYQYVLEATPVGSLDLGGPHTTGRLTATSYRFAGLVNYEEYGVRAIAYSKADNPSDPSFAVSATPQEVRDFWRTYKEEFGGQETGGCSSGLAGPVGLGVLLATLALARRRR